MTLKYIILDFMIKEVLSKVIRDRDIIYFKQHISEFIEDLDMSTLDDRFSLTEHLQNILIEISNIKYNSKKYLLNDSDILELDKIHIYIQKIADTYISKGLYLISNDDDDDDDDINEIINGYIEDNWG